MLDCTIFEIGSRSGLPPVLDLCAQSRYLDTTLAIKSKTYESLITKVPRGQILSKIQSQADSRV